MIRDLLIRLHGHQTEILDIVDRAETMLGGSRDVAGLSRIRWVLVRVMGRYQIFKHSEVLDPLIARGSPLDAQRATRMKEACLAPGEAFHEHVRRWSASDVDAEWTVFQPAAQMMMGRIRAHIAREQAEIDALLARQPGPIRPPPASARRPPDRPTPAG